MALPYRIDHKPGPGLKLGDWVGEYARTLDTFFYVDDADVDDPAGGRYVGDKNMIAGALIVPPCQAHYIVHAKASIRADLADDDKDNDEPVGAQVKAQLLVGPYRVPGWDELETDDRALKLLSGDPGLPVDPAQVSLLNRDLTRVHLVRHRDDPGADLMGVALQVVTMITGDRREFSGSDWLRIDLRLDAEADAKSSYDLSIHGVRITATAIDWASGGAPAVKPWS